MFEYFYGWIPLFIVGGVFFLTLPWLGLVALLAAAVLALLVLAALAWAVFIVTSKLGHGITRRWHGPGAVHPQTAGLPRLPKLTGSDGAVTHQAPQRVKR